VTRLPGPRELRASDADRDLVLAVLADAVADGRLRPDEHADRAAQACAARTLGELAALTADLAPAAAQPIRLETGRSLAAVLTRAYRDGRWVVPPRLAVMALLGEAVLDFRQAVLPAVRVTLDATAIAGQVRLIVPDGVAVQLTGRAAVGTSGSPSAPVPGAGTIEVRALTLAGRVLVVTARRARWQQRLLRRYSPMKSTAL
jgi:hypothetical protein